MLNPDVNKFLTAGEMEKFKAVIKEKAKTSRVHQAWFCFIRIALETGMRVSEMCDLKIKHIYLDGNSFIRVKGKGGRIRNVIIPKKLRLYLSFYIIDRNLKHDDYLLTSSHGKPFTRYGLSYVWHKCLKLAELPERGIHQSRHSYAFYLMDKSGSDLKLVQSQLGHSNISITSTYLHLNKEQISNKIDSIF